MGTLLISKIREEYPGEYRSVCLVLLCNRLAAQAFIADLSTCIADMKL